jgi:hypothetical protein
VKPTCYRVIVEGELGPRYIEAFAPMRIDPGAGTTAIVGVVTDQSALFGVLETVSGLGLSLISVAPDDYGDAPARDDLQ